jgi:hypothetical protein
MSAHARTRADTLKPPSPQTTNGKTPEREIPQSPEAEKGVLASLLLAPAQVFQLCAEANLDARQFYISAHGIIFDTITGIIIEGKTPDFITIAQQLRDGGKLDQVGGAAAISELFTHLATAATTPHYIGIVRDQARRRHLIGIAETLKRGASDGGEEVEEVSREAERAIGEAARLAPKPAPLVSLMDISAGATDPRANLLGNRFLCIGGAGIFVGPSGIGKSSASVQQDVLWSLGRPAFDIRPARPLRILTIQAENDAEDLAEMRDGVIKGLRLTEEDREQVRGNVFYETECGRTGAEFLRYVDRRLAKMQFDLLRIDPLLAYLGADINDAEQTAAFLRTGLNPLLAKHRVACIVNHHTPKVTNRDTSNWRASDWMYSGAGSADVTNWARAILVIDPTHADGLFRFIAAKRGSRIGWTGENGEPTIFRCFGHARDGIYWRDADEQDIAALGKAIADKKRRQPSKTTDDMWALVPMQGEIPKVTLLQKARECGFTKHGAEATLAEMLHAERLFVAHHKRPRTNAEVRISRHRQATLEGMK